MAADILAEAHVVVVGGGNAGLCAALAAAEAGASVVMLDAAPSDLRGGSSAFATGTMRTAFDGVGDVRKLVPSLSDAELRDTDFGEYPRQAFFEDLARLSDYRADPELTDVLVSESLETLLWMTEQGVRFLPMYQRQAFRVGGRMKFWGGAVVEVSGGGFGLVEALTEAAQRQGVSVHYEARVVSLIEKNGHIQGVSLAPFGLHGRQDVLGRSTVLASGGFEANAEWRARYLGPGWDLARVRGSRFGNGDGIRMALELGAAPFGHWSGCHGAAVDFNSPQFGDRTIGTGFSRHSYPLGIIVNASGERFVDEGADFRNYTYGSYGHAIMRQAGQRAWQVFDGKVLPLLRGEYRARGTTKIKANDLVELSQKMTEIDQNAFLRTVQEYNAAVCSDVPFDPTIKDGRGTRGLAIPKSNWANAIDTSPFEAYEVTCGIALTYGGLHIDRNGAVLDMLERPMPGLYAAGSTVGGLFYHTVPSGSSLTAGSVFGRTAGREAARYALQARGSV